MTSGSKWRTPWLSIAGAALVVAAVAGLLTEKGPETTSVRTRRASASGATGSPAGGWVSASADEPTETAASVVATEEAGQGLTVEYEPASAPVVPAGTDPGEYLREYYSKVLAGKEADAFEMVRPSARAAIEGFEPLQDPRFDVSRYSVVATVPVDGDTKLFVAQTTHGNGVWTVIWDFVKTPRGDALKSLTFTRASEFPCH